MLWWSAREHKAWQIGVEGASSVHSLCYHAAILNDRFLLSAAALARGSRR